MLLHSLQIYRRSDFFPVLREAIASTRSLAAKHSAYWLWQAILEQLEAIEQWTANGREPTHEERSSISFHVLATHEIDPPPKDLERYLLLLGELAFYFEHWARDDRYARLDDEPLRFYWPLDDTGSADA